MDIDLAKIAEITEEREFLRESLSLSADLQLVALSGRSGGFFAEFALLGGAGFFPVLLLSPLTSIFSIVLFLQLGQDCLHRPLEVLGHAEGGWVWSAHDERSR